MNDAGRSAISPKLAARGERLLGGTALHGLASRAAHELWWIEHDQAAELALIEQVA